MTEKLLIILLLSVVSCSPPPIPDPEAVKLLSPENLNECTSAYSINDSQSQVTFRWSQSLHTDTYELVVVNSQTRQQKKEQTTLQTLNMVLEKGYPYEWRVLSLSDASLVETTSASWQFYLESNADVSHIPFATFLLSPPNKATVNSGTIDFQWEGNDLDSEALKYDFYFGPSIDELEPQVTSLSAETYSFSIDEVGTYYWKVDTIDATGNRASSIPYILTVQ